MPTTPPLTLDVYGQTDQGIIRSDNQDALLMDTQHQIYAVADGLGGLSGGAQASMLAVERVKSLIAGDPPEEQPDLEYLFREMQNAVQEEGDKIEDELGMGTTFTMVNLRGNAMRIGHMGDSGIFLFRNEEVFQLTMDHTMAQEILDSQHATSRISIPEYYYHTLTRCLGQESDGGPDIFEHKIQQNDRYLLYSDGVTKVFNHEELLERIYQFNDAQSFVEFVIHMSNERGGPDNTTAIALFFS